MKEFLKKVILGNGISPPEICLQSFIQNFENALNVEWHKKHNYFEVLFYRNNLEHIAHFSLNGFLTEYIQKVPFEFLPEAIKDIALEKGEIMNVVMKNKGNTIEYELILRDKAKNRTLLVVSDMGELVEQKGL